MTPTKDDLRFDVAFFEIKETLHKINESRLLSLQNLILDELMARDIDIHISRHRASEQEQPYTG